MLRRVWTKLLRRRCGGSDDPDGGKSHGSMPDDITEAADELPVVSLDGAAVPNSHCLQLTKRPQQQAAGVGIRAGQPLPYHRYQPTVCTPLLDLSVKYWFYVYLHSSESDRLLAPFYQLCQETELPSDRRLMCLMNRCKVRISLRNPEMYKSLPRYILALQGPSWDAIVRAVVELEDQFPRLMQFANHPLMMDANTCRFASTNWRQTALQTRVTRCS